MVGDDATAARRKAVFGLWCLQGIGHAALEAITAVYPDPSVLLDEVPRTWLGSVGLTEPQSAHLAAMRTTLRAFADEMFGRANDAAMKICWADAPEYPRRLSDIELPPPLLFYWGRGDRPNARRRLAMVGSRKYETNYTEVVSTLGEQLAAQVIVVSGGAEGIDQLCHRAAMAAGGETWAFMGAGLDELDRPQAELAPRIVDHGGTVFSNFPPGTRPDRHNFVIRNRFIAGSSDAVFVLRAKRPSGALDTATHGLKQGKPLFTMPGQIDHLTSRGPNFLLQKRMARIATCAADVLEGMGVSTAVSPKPPPPAAPQVDLTALSAAAQAAYGALSAIAVDFDGLLALAAPLTSGQLASALVELELSGLLRQQPGRRFERA